MEQIYSMKISIITINYNNKIGLEKTISSVISQSYRDFEYIVIDGGSNDGSYEIIRGNSSQIDYWVSETDGGIYNAMNKGINMAKGEYLLMLNSGDRLASSSILSDVFKSKKNQEDILYGNILWESKNGFLKVSDFPEHLNKEYFWEKSIGHQSAFIRRSAHNIVGLYDENLKFSSDWKFFILCFLRHKLTFKFLPFPISIGDCEGVSWDPSNFYSMTKEKNATLKVFFPNDYTEFKRFQRRIKVDNWTKLILFKKHIEKKVKSRITWI